MGQVSPDSSSAVQSWLATSSTSTPGSHFPSARWTAAGSPQSSFRWSGPKATTIDSPFSAFTYREALAAELAAAGIDHDDAFVHLVFAALDGVVFQLVSLGNPAAAHAAVDRLRELLRKLA